jgi:chromosome segregation ATPase
MNLANEISSLESQIESLRADNDALKNNLAVLEFENDSLRKHLAKANADRDNLMRRGEAIKALLDQTGASLCLGLQKFHEREREITEQQRLIGAVEITKVLTSNGNGKAEEGVAN